MVTSVYIVLGNVQISVQPSTKGRPQLLVGTKQTDRHARGIAWECLFMCCHMRAVEAREGFDLLNVELEAVISYLMWVLGTEL